MTNKTDETKETDDHVKRFDELVNMTPKQLETWLDTDESKSVGQVKNGAHESVGHRMGREIVKILHKPKRDHTDDDREHMTKVVGYISRHLAQRPDGDVKETPWRYSLMNWGHDPLKKD